MKHIVSILLVLCTLFILAACGNTTASSPSNEKESIKECTHDWADATCQTPKTCKLCGITDGTDLAPHTNTPICEVCGRDNFSAVFDAVAESVTKRTLFQSVTESGTTFNYYIDHYGTRLEVQLHIPGKPSSMSLEFKVSRDGTYAYELTPFYNGSSVNSSYVYCNDLDPTIITKSISTLPYDSSITSITSDHNQAAQMAASSLILLLGEFSSYISAHSDGGTLQQLGLINYQ